MTVYYIGGSPCSGKSTIAEYLAKHFDMLYYKVDDYLDDYMRKAASDGFALAERFATMSCDETWLRDPMELCRDEVAYYMGIFDYIMAEIRKIQTDKPIITEGAALMPALMKKMGVPRNRYLCIVPDADFQNAKYVERPWIDQVLEDSSDKRAAFSNWMARDAFFALHVLEEARNLGYETIVTGADTPLAENIDKTIRTFALD
jgi:2-phosphoglycerate kinase